MVLGTRFSGCCQVRQVPNSTNAHTQRQMRERTHHRKCMCVLPPSTQHNCRYYYRCLAPTVLPPSFPTPPASSRQPLTPRQPQGCMEAAHFPSPPPSDMPWQCTAAKCSATHEGHGPVLTSQSSHSTTGMTSVHWNMLQQELCAGLPRTQASMWLEPKTPGSCTANSPPPPAARKAV